MASSSGSSHRTRTSPGPTWESGFATTSLTKPLVPARTSESSGAQTTPSVRVQDGNGITNSNRYSASPRPVTRSHARPRRSRSTGLVATKRAALETGSTTMLNAAQSARITPMKKNFPATNRTMAV